jgi:hypothetical protein
MSEQSKKLRILDGFQTAWLDYPDNELLSMIVSMLCYDNCCNGCQNNDLKNYTYNHSSIIEYTVDDLCYNLIKEYQSQTTNKIFFQVETL